MVIAYRATRNPLNFASTAMGAISTYICYELIQHGMPGWAGLVVGIAAGALLGRSPIVLCFSSGVPQFWSSSSSPWVCSAGLNIDLAVLGCGHD